MEKEKEIIQALNAVESKEYYNVAPGGPSRPDGFTMSEKEREKMDYLKKLMDNEVLYGVKVEDEERCKAEDKLPKIMFVKALDATKYCIYTIADDTLSRNKNKSDEDAYDSYFSVMKRFHELQYKDKMINFLRRSNYLIISKETFDKYMFEATESRKSFARIKKEIITNKNKEDSYFNAKKQKDQTTLSSYSGNILKANEGTNYFPFSTLYEKYNDFDKSVVYHALTGRGSLPANLKDLRFSTEQIEAASLILDYERRFSGIKIKGRRLYFNMALDFCYRLESIDNETLWAKIFRSKKIPPIESIEQAIEVIEKIYNNRSSQNRKIYIKQEYIKNKKLQRKT